MAKNMTACQEATKPTLLKVEPEAEHEDVSKEEAARALKKRHGDRDLAVRRRGQPKKWTQGSGRSRKSWPAVEG
jgi:hypothetical protein